MTTTYHAPGELVDLRPLGDSLAGATTTVFVNTCQMRIARLVLLTGAETATHEAPGELTMHCLEGRVTVNVAGTDRELSAGQLLHLAAGEPHSLRADEDTSVLLTIVHPRQTEAHCMDTVQEASEESFPASDPPARTPITGP